MKRIWSFLVVISTLIVLSSGCSKNGLEGLEDGSVERHTLTFCAVAPKDRLGEDKMKTVLMPEDGVSRLVYWQEGDRILVFDVNNLSGAWSEPLSAADIFDENDEVSEKIKDGKTVGPSANFTVTMEGSCTGPFYALYGISQDNVKSFNFQNGKFEVVLPSGQTYCADGFAQGENPSVAYCHELEETEEASFNFVNLCGMLHLTVPQPSGVPSGAVLTNVEIYDNNKEEELKGYLSGKFTVDGIVEDKDGVKVQSSAPSLRRELSGEDGGGAKNKNLIIGGNVISGGPYELYFIAPVGSFHNAFTYILTFSDGSKFKQTLNPNSIKTVDGKTYGKWEVLRGVITNYTTTQIPSPIDDPQVPQQTANCHIIAPRTGQTVIPAGQTYAIPVGFKGNGAQGNGGDEKGQSDYKIANQSFCAGSFPIEGGEKAEVIWQTKNSSTGIVTEHELISGISYNAAKKQIIFTATGVEGNALVALKDANGTVLWSWHLWITNKKGKEGDDLGIELSNGAVVMDRNLGALSNNPADKELTYGQQYQWGRKDPFQGCSAMETAQGGGYNGFYIMYPYQAVQVQEDKSLTLEESIAGPHYIAKDVGGYSWINPSDDSRYGWSKNYKTLWDPCPVGWHVVDDTYFFDVKYDELGFATVTPKYPGDFVENGYRIGQNGKYSFLPAAGHGEVNILYGVGTVVQFWTTNHKEYQAQSVSIKKEGGKATFTYDYSKIFYSIPVRCKKFEEPQISQLKED